MSAGRDHSPARERGWIASRRRRVPARVIPIEQNFRSYSEQKWAWVKSRLIPGLASEIMVPRMEAKMLESETCARLRRVAWLLRARDVEIKLRSRRGRRQGQFQFE